MSTLFSALDVHASDIVAFVGAGGKTSAMFRLAGELAAAGRGVVVTTTTHIREPIVTQAAVIVLERDESAMLEQLPPLVQRYGLVALGSGLTKPAPGEVYRKLEGVAPTTVGRIAQLSGVDHVLVEADGAKGRSLKAPAAHEPVVPEATTLLVPVAAVDAIERRLDDRVAHRPELVERLTGLPQGAAITPGAVAAVLCHPQGGLKGRPLGARVVPLINKAESSDDLARALEVASILLQDDKIDRVVIGAVARPEGPLQVVVRPPARLPRESGRTAKVVAVVLTAGASRRFGSPKQLLPVGGLPMLTKVTDAVLASSVDETIVVLGSRAEEVRQVLAGRPVRIVLNPDWQEGLASSIRAGLAAIPVDADAALFVLADAIRLTSSEVDAVIWGYRPSAAEHASGDRPTAEQPLIVAPAHGGKRGNPVLFDRAFFGELASLHGDEGGRRLLERHASSVRIVEVPTDGVVADVDRPADVPGL